jgi:hypothetical protein
MDLSDTLEAYDGLRKFVKEHLLPRLDLMEREIYLLKRITWPVCSVFHEQHQTSHIRLKSELLHSMDDLDLEKMVRMKDRIGFPQGPSHHGRWEDELDAIKAYLLAARCGPSSRGPSQ